MYTGSAGEGFGTNGGDLPDVTIPPRLADALSVAWNIVWQDIVGAMFVAFVLGILVLIGSVLLQLVSDWLQYVTFVIVGPLTVGFLGWAETHRLGRTAGLNDVFTIAVRRFPDTIYLYLTLQVISLVYSIPLLVALVGLFGPWFKAMQQMPGAQSPQPTSPFWFEVNLPVEVLIGLAVWGAVVAVVFGPALESVRSLGSWAIAKGRPFKEALFWGYERVKAHFFGWWLTGLVITFLSGIGTIACYVGVFVTVPWSMLAWAQIAGDEGGDSWY